MTRCVRAFAVSLLAIAWSIGCSQTGATQDDGEVRTGTGAGGGSVVMTGNGGQAAGTTPLPYCGDRVLDISIGETCDDGNHDSGDGCSALCLVECTWVCARCDQQGRCLPSVCGNGNREGIELCDDGGRTDGDGCSHTCVIEDGWFCPIATRPCVPICGDRKVVGPETCDDGNADDGDGCSSTCLVEPTTARCGDGVVQGAEACDPDGIAFTELSCAQDCRYVHYCGDETVDAELGEECDLGVGKNVGSYGDKGCMPNCRRAHYCGDGVVDPPEQCDLGEEKNGNPTVTPCARNCTVLLP